MSEKNWTPGPWSIEPARDERCGGTIAIVNRDHPRDDWDVCEVHSTEANAHLIRTAPELYDALDLTAIWLKAALDCKLFPWDADQHEAATESLAGALEVLAKARGAQ